MTSVVCARIVSMAVAALAVAACGSDDGGPAARQPATAETEVEALDPALASRLPPGTTLQIAEEGRRLFDVCAVCHGLDASGTELGPPLNDGEWISISGELAEIEAVTRAGVAEPGEYPVPMPVMGGGDFDDEQIRALATYVYVLSRGTP